MEIINGFLLPTVVKVISLSIKGSLILAFILPLRAWLLARHRHGAIRLLWLVLLFQLAVPFQIETALSPIPGVLDATAPAPLPAVTPISPPSGAGSAAPVLPLEASSPAPASFTLLSLLALVWLAGAVLFGLSSSLTHVKFTRRLMRSAHIAPLDLLKLCARLQARLKIRGRVRLVESDAVASPCTYGLVRPVIVLPPCLAERLGPRQIECVLAHELAHVGRRDLLLLAGAALLTALHWWNPLVWIAFRIMRRDQEYSCDAAALIALGEGRVRRYGRTVLKMAALLSARPSSRCALGIMDTRNHFRRRIVMIASFHGQPVRRRVLGAALALAASLLLCTRAVRADDRLINDAGRTVLFRPPVASAKATLEFGWVKRPGTLTPFFHNGIDLALPEGTSVTAAADGVVADVNERADHEYGRYIVIRHADGFVSFSTKLDKIFVRRDQAVKAGEPIGLSGNTGVSTGPHLHFTLTREGNPVNPREYILF